MTDLKSALARDFKTVTNDYCILFVLVLIGSFIVPFYLLIRPILGLVYLLIMLAFLFLGLNKLLYLSVFDDGSKYFGGYMEDLSAGILSKSLVSAFGMMEVLLLPVGAAALTVSMKAAEWQELIDWYAGFCSNAAMVKPLLLTEVLNLAVTCILTGMLMMLTTICIIKILGTDKSEAFREFIQIIGYLLCAGIGTALYLWWLPVGLDNSIAVCLVSTLVKLVLFAALVPVVKKQVVSLYEKL